VELGMRPLPPLGSMQARRDGPFSPLSLGPIIFLRGDSATLTGGSPNKISSWTDQSGNGNHAVQGTDASRPQYTASNANFNGQPTADFAGGQTLTVSMPGGYNAVTLFYAYRPITAIAGRPIVTQGLVARSFYAAGDAIISTGASGFDQLTFTAADQVNTKYYKACRFPFSTLSSSAPDSTRNGSAQTGTATSNTGTDTTLNALTWTIGSTVLASVAEFFVVPYLASAQQIADVYAYEVARYG
jgi:hypothetical protein